MTRKTELDDPWPKLNLPKLLRDLADAVENNHVYDAPNVDVDSSGWRPAPHNSCVGARYRLDITSDLLVELGEQVGHATWSGYPYDALHMVSAERIGR